MPGEVRRTWFCPQERQRRDAALLDEFDVDPAAFVRQMIHRRAKRIARKRRAERRMEEFLRARRARSRAEAILMR
jgi:hypothetical protein